jgi:copper ion binding protein
VRETLSVPEVSCDHCKQTVEGALNVLAGVDEAHVDVPAKTVAVSYDERAVSRTDLVSAIEAAGYDVES